MLLVDVHCHIHLCPNPVGVVSDSFALGVKKIVTAGLDFDSNLKSLSLSDGSSFVRASIGLHPTVLSDDWKRHVDLVTQQILKNSDRIVAIGEIGLDYTVDFSKDVQKNVFVEFLSLAENIGLPVVVHSRKAEFDVLEILDSRSVKHVILHSFGGRISLVKRAVNSGFMFSIPSNIDRSSHYQKIVEVVPISQILTETDAPYQSSVKGVPSVPGDVAKSIPVIAKIKNLTPIETANNIFMNYTRVFKN
ncbi:TatD family hydrolase [Candidatus Woesearchaeota archaeon]|nr:TatD family hydrolase [Candidatus Woesearchaeota archaeon]